jgi:putative Holliday junction resolvase
MKYLGIDYGAKRVGIAVTEMVGNIAFPRAEIPNDKELLHFLVRMIEREKIERIIVGDTRTHGGAENPITADAKVFVARLARACTVPVEFAPEMWSSIEASRYAPHGGEHSNAAAAAIILQRYLDMRG